jgi:hypothetical protein
MAISFAPYVVGDGFGVVRFKALRTPGTPPGLTQRPVDPEPDKDFRAAVQSGFDTVCYRFPTLARARVSSHFKRYPADKLPPLQGPSIYGVSVFVFAKLAVELFPDLDGTAIRGLRIDRIGITAIPGAGGTFAEVGDKIALKLSALVSAPGIALGVIPRNQRNAPWRAIPQRDLYSFDGPNDRRLLVAECDSPWECFERLYRLQAQSILFGAD